MANLRLSNAVLGQLARPGFSENVGEAIGQAMLGPENRRKEREKLEAITGIATATNAGVAASQMSDLAGLNESISDLQSRLSATTDATIASEITKQIGTLQGLVPQTRKGAALNSVNALEAARQAARTPEEKRNIENIMERVARESGNSVQGIIGRTDSEIQTQRTRDEQRISDNFYAVPKENRAAYLKGAEARGFGQIASILEARELEREADQIKIDEARESADLRRTPLPVAGLKKRIEALPDSQEKTDLLKRIEVAESQNIKKGGTFEPGQRKQLADQLTSINDGITRAAGRQDQARLIVERQTEDEIQRLQRDLTRIKIDDDQVEEEARRLEKEKGSDMPFIGTTYKDFMAEARQKLEEQTRKEIQGQIDRLRGSSDSNTDDEGTGYTDAQEAKIKANMDAFPNKTREEVIAALKSKGALKEAG